MIFFILYLMQNIILAIQCVCVLVAQFSSVAQSCLTLCDPMNCSTPVLPDITNSRRWHKLMSIKSVMPYSHLILCRPLLLPSPIPPSIRVFSNVSALRMRWPKYWSFMFYIYTHIHTYIYIYIYNFLWFMFFCILPLLFM